MLLCLYGHRSVKAEWYEQVKFTISITTISQSRITLTDIYTKTIPTSNILPWINGQTGRWPIGLEHRKTTDGLIINMGKQDVYTSCEITKEMCNESHMHSSCNAKDITQWSEISS